MSDLDDDQMMEFDAKLSEVFRNRKSFKAEKRDALKAILDFMLRTIDLLEIFVKKQPANPLVLEIIMPALDALRTVWIEALRYSVLNRWLKYLSVDLLGLWCCMSVVIAACSVVGSTVAFIMPCRSRSKTGTKSCKSGWRD